MKLSTKTRYGTRVLLELARNKSDGPIQVGKIAERQKISVKYLEQVILSLRRGGLVKSVRGAKGGHLLAENPENINLGQVVRIFETQTELVDCVDSPETCDMADDCLARAAWKAATEALYKKLDSISIASMLKQDINCKM